MPLKFELVIFASKGEMSYVLLIKLQKLSPYSPKSPKLGLIMNFWSNIDRELFIKGCAMRSSLKV